MKRFMIATVALAALTLPAMAQSPNQVKQPPEAMPQQKKMQSQRDWTPQQEAARPPTHQGEEQKFGAGQDSTVGQSSSPASEAAKPIPEHDIKPPEANAGK